MVHSELSTGDIPEATNTEKNSITIENLVYRTQERSFELVIDRLEIRSGELVAITGTSGIGKTTLLELVSGQRIPERGTVDVGGVRVSGLNQSERATFRNQQIGIVFQDFRLLPYLSVLDNIQVVRWVGEFIDRQQTSTLAAVLAEHCGIGHLTKRYPNRLSQGERQRAAVARAFINQPSVVLADEPTGNLDPTTAGMILDLILTTCREHGSTLILVTHDHSLLDRFERVIDFSELTP